jgi:hypothetical protein
MRPTAVGPEARFADRSAKAWRAKERHADAGARAAGQFEGLDHVFPDEHLRAPPIPLVHVSLAVGALPPPRATVPIRLPG